MRRALVINDITLDFNQQESVSINCQSGTINLDLNYTQFGLINSYRTAQESQTYYDLDCSNLEGFLFTMQDCENK